MNESDAIIFVVDDDAAMRRSLARPRAWLSAVRRRSALSWRSSRRYSLRLVIMR